jgi:hypothetical protein
MPSAIMRRSDQEQRLLDWNALVKCVLPLDQTLSLPVRGERLTVQHEQVVEWTALSPSVDLFPGFSSSTLECLMDRRLIRVVFVLPLSSFRSAEVQVDSLYCYLVPQDLPGFRSVLLQELRGATRGPSVEAAFSTLLSRLQIPASQFEKKTSSEEDGDVIIASASDTQPLLDVTNVRSRNLLVQSTSDRLA